MEAKPVSIPAYSFTFRKMWENKKGKTWYYETGLTTMPVGVKAKEYPNDSLNTWSYSTFYHTAFPSIVFGIGRVFPISGKQIKQDLALGLEGSIKIVHGVTSSSPNFGLEYSAEDEPFPLYLRVNTGYGMHVKLLRNIPIYIQAYTNLSFQNIIKAPHYLRNPVTGLIEEGKYTLNNSEIGIKIFANTDVNYNKLKWVKRAKGPKGPAVFRVSLEAQTYVPPATEYWIPKVDSFSLIGHKYTFTQQAGIKAELPHSRNKHWAMVASFGVGLNTFSSHFTAIPSYTREGKAADSGPHGSMTGLHLIPGIGLAYKHPVGNSYLQHSVAATFVIPVSQDNQVFEFIEKYDPNVSPFLQTALMRGQIDYRLGRSKILAGLEYQPELLFHLDKRFFTASAWCSISATAS
ncbi:MAG: hypothetical protein IPJ00_09335 [Saprospirales bacterium]|nr:hypothetical protein [Saprospirales bacterium]